MVSALLSQCFSCYSLTSKSITTGLSFVDSNQFVKTVCPGKAPFFSQARAAAYSDLPPFTRETDCSADSKMEPERGFHHSIVRQRTSKTVDVTTEF